MYLTHLIGFEYSIVIFWFFPRHDYGVVYQLSFDISGLTWDCKHKDLKLLLENIKSTANSHKVTCPSIHATVNEICGRYRLLSQVAA